MKLRIDVVWPRALTPVILAGCAGLGSLAGVACGPPPAATAASPSDAGPEGWPACPAPAEASLEGCRALPAVALKGLGTLAAVEPALEGGGAVLVLSGRTISRLDARGVSAPASARLLGADGIVPSAVAAGADGVAAAGLGADGSVAIWALPALDGAGEAATTLTITGASTMFGSGTAAGYAWWIERLDGSVAMLPTDARGRRLGGPVQFEAAATLGRPAGGPLRPVLTYLRRLDADGVAELVFSPLASDGTRADKVSVETRRFGPGFRPLVALVDEDEVLVQGGALVSLAAGQPPCIDGRATLVPEGPRDLAVSGLRAAFLLDGSGGVASLHLASGAAASGDLMAGAPGGPYAVGRARVFPAPGGFVLVAARASEPDAIVALSIECP